MRLLNLDGFSRKCSGFSLIPSLLCATCKVLAPKKSFSKKKKSHLGCFKNGQYCMVKLLSKCSAHLITTWQLEVAKTLVVKSGSKASVIHLGHLGSWNWVKWVVVAGSPPVLGKAFPRQVKVALSYSTTHQVLRTGESRVAAVVKHCLCSVAKGADVSPPYRSSKYPPRPQCVSS